MKLIKKCEVRFTVQDINSTHCSFVQEVRSFNRVFPSWINSHKTTTS